jgi:hypothetical protein
MLKKFKIDEGEIFNLRNVNTRMVLFILYIKRLKNIPCIEWNTSKKD